MKCLCRNDDALQANKCQASDLKVMRSAMDGTCTDCVARFVAEVMRREVRTGKGREDEEMERRKDQKSI